MVWQYRGEEVEVGGHANFLFDLTEAKLTKALLEIEKSLPTKNKDHVMAKGGDQRAGTSGSKRFPMAGRNAVASLKKVLPKVQPAELKKMFKTLAAEGTGVPADKADLVKAIVGLILPGFPYEQPHRGSKDAEEEGGDE